MFPFSSSGQEFEYENKYKERGSPINELKNLIDKKKKRTKWRIQKCFGVLDLDTMLEDVNNTKNMNKNEDLVNAIKSGLVNFKNEIAEMSEDEKEIKRPDELLNIAGKVLDYNNESQEGELKLLALNQILSRLPISLTQLQAWNNSQKFKNEIRQLLYSLYCSKKINQNNLWTFD